MALVAAIGSVLLKAILPGLATAAGTLLVGILGKQLKRAGIELTDKQREQLSKLVEAAVIAVEERARRRALEGAPMTSEEKRNEAVAMVLSERGDLLGDDVEPIIDSLLPKVRQLLPMAARLPVAATRH